MLTGLSPLSRAGFGALPSKVLMGRTSTVSMFLGRVPVSKSDTCDVIQVSDWFEDAHVSD